MDINYNIIWFEDIDEWYNTLSRRLTRYIKSKNLKVNIDSVKNVKEFDIQDYHLDKYDLLVVDYELEDNTHGNEIIKMIRSGKFVNDILFYSSHGFSTINEVMKEEGLQGVFIADRDNGEFIDTAKLLVDKSLRRSENLVNIRGIVMDNTSEFDNKVREVIGIAWNHLGESRQNIINYIKNDLLENYKSSSKRFIDKYETISEYNINELLSEREFTAYMQARLLNKCINSNVLKGLFSEVYCKCFEEKTLAGKMKFFEKYNADIIDYRNALAHVKKSENGQGEIFIGKINGNDVVFDSVLCNEIRGMYIPLA